jgi:Family of unknown function (DUF6350)
MLAWPIALVWAWVISLVLVGIPALIGWAAAPEEASFALIPRAADLWVIAMAPPLTVDGVPISLMPWGFTLIWFALVAIGVRWAARFAPHPPLRILLIVFVSSMLVTAGLAALIGRLATFQIEPWAVSWRATAVAALGCLIGAYPVLVSHLRVPSAVVRGMRATVLAVGGIMGVAAALLVIALLRNIGAIVEMWSALAPGAMGGFVLLVLQLGYLPVLLVWSAAYLTGAGVVIGDQATISPFIATASSIDLPPVPVLVALPTTASPLMWLLPAVVALVGWWSVRRALRGTKVGRGERLAVAMSSALAAAVIMSVLAVMAHGSLGVARLASVGPTPSVVGWLTFGLLALGGGVAALLGGSRQRTPIVEVVAHPDDEVVKESHA